MARHARAFLLRLSNNECRVEGKEGLDKEHIATKRLTGYVEEN